MNLGIKAEEVYTEMEVIIMDWVKGNLLDVNDFAFGYNSDMEKYIGTLCKVTCLQRDSAGRWGCRLVDHQGNVVGSAEHGGYGFTFDLRVLGPGVDDIYILK